MVQIYLEYVFDIFVSSGRLGLSFSSLVCLSFCSYLFVLSYLVYSSSHVFLFIFSCICVFHLSVCPFFFFIFFSCLCVFLTSLLVISRNIFMFFFPISIFLYGSMIRSFTLSSLCCVLLTLVFCVFLLLTNLLLFVFSCFHFFYSDSGPPFFYLKTVCSIFIFSAFLDHFQLLCYT